MRGVCLSATIAAASPKSSFYWFSDLHLDLLYRHNATQSTYCRPDHFNFTEFRSAWESHFLLPPIPQLDPEEVRAYEPSQITSLPTTDSNVGEALLPAYHGRYGCDTPATLLWAALSSARENIKRRTPAFVLVTGDLSGHYWLPETKIMRFLTMYAATELLYKSLDLSWKIRGVGGDYDNQLEFLNNLNALPKTDEQRNTKYQGPQIVICVGNNDMAGDYKPHINSTWNEAQYKMWEHIIVPPRERTNFVRGQYYSVSIKDTSPHVRVVCLNSVWWSRQAGPAPDPADDPAGQFRWLREVLEEARRNNEHVILAGHIPPVQALYRNVLSGFTLDDQWHTIYAERYRLLVREYGGTVKAQLFGHLHTDEFRVQYEAERPCGLVLIAPSVCANHGTNPSWRKVHFDPSDLSLINYSQIYTPLYGHDRDLGTFDQDKLPFFSRKYTSTKHFGVGALTPSHMQQALDNRLLDTQFDARRLWCDELVSGNFPPPFLLRCVIQEKSGAASCLRALINSTTPRGEDVTQIAE